MERCRTGTGKRTRVGGHCMTFSQFDSLLPAYQLHRRLILDIARSITVFAYLFTCM